MVIGTIAMMIVARYAGPETLGILGYWLAFVTTFGFLQSLDIESAHLKIIPTKRDRESKSRAIGAYSSIKVALILGSALVLCLVYVLRSESLDATGESNARVFYMMLVYFVLSGLGMILLTTFAAIGQTAKQQLPSMVGTIARYTLLAVLAMSLLSAVWLSTAYALGAAVTLILALILFRGHSISKPTSDELKEYMALSGPLMAAPIFTTAIMNVDRIALGHFWDSTVVGVYFLAQTIAFSLLFLGKAVRLVLIPSYSQDLGEGRLEVIVAQSRQLARFSSVLFIPLVIFLLVFSEPYIAFLFGASFTDAGPSLAILLIGVWLLLMADPLASFVLAKGKPIRVLVSAVLGLLTSLICLLLFVPDSIGSVQLLGLSGLGASLAFVVSSAVQLTSYRISSREMEGYFSFRTIAIALVSCILSAVPCYLFETVLNSHGLSSLSMLFLPLVFVVLVFTCLILMRGLSGNDIRYLKRILSIKQMVRYVVEEISK
jgi:O-antigen/teichoic acid export membrane protein